MDEKETNEEDKSKEPVKTEEGGVQSETGRTIDDLNLASKRMEEATEKMRIETNRALDFEAKRRTGGVTEAGQETQQRTQEQKKTDNAKEFFKGTALGDAISKVNE